MLKSSVHDFICLYLLLYTADTHKSVSTQIWFSRERKSDKKPKCSKKPCLHFATWAQVLCSLCCLRASPPGPPQARGFPRLRLVDNEAHILHSCQKTPLLCLLWIISNFLLFCFILLPPKKVCCCFVLLPQKESLVFYLLFPFTEMEKGEKILFYL